jgi:O-antigen ligase
MRFASFFANPLELASSTILALSILAALATSDRNKIHFSNFNKIALAATLICIFLAFSRAAFVNYFFTILVYAIITKNKLILNTFYLVVISFVLYVAYLLKDEEVLDFVIETVKFTNSSSVGHLLEWIEGINAMMVQPLGLGLGTSGRVGGSFNGNTGGENQFLIIGVQTGIIAMLIYLSIYILIMAYCWKWMNSLKGKERQVCMALFLMKTGFIIPMMTSELESSAYISYTTWFLSGFFISIISYHQTKRKVTTENNKT